MSTVALCRDIGYHPPSAKAGTPFISTQMTLLIEPANSNQYLTATVIDRGPSDQEWIKVQLPNGDECFAYPDTDETIDSKQIEPGLAVAISTPRPCRKPGSTKWTTNLLHVNLQTNHAKLYKIAQQDFSSEVSAPTCDDEVNSIHSTKVREVKRPSLCATYTILRDQYIDKVATAYGFSGRYARGHALGHVIDTCMASGLL
jgi:hypothetical protein